MVSIFMLFWGGKSKYYNALLRCHRFAESSKFLKKQLVLLPISSNSKFSETPSRLYQVFSQTTRNKQIKTILQIFLEILQLNSVSNLPNTSN